MAWRSSRPVPLCALFGGDIARLAHIASPVVQALVWSDYVCPWCYVALDRSQRLDHELGVAVTPVPYELHPDTSAAGRAVGAGGAARLFDRIETECASAGMGFRPPRRIPNSHRALASSEWVRHHAPSSHADVHRALFEATFTRGEPIDDPDVVDAVVAASGADAVACRAAVDSGAMDAALVTAREMAHDHGISGTPSWLIDGRLVIAGLQPIELFERLVNRLRSRAEKLRTGPDLL